MLDVFSKCSNLGDGTLRWARSSTRASRVVKAISTRENIATTMKAHGLPPLLSRVYCHTSPNRPFIAVPEITHTLIIEYVSPALFGESKPVPVHSVHLAGANTSSACDASGSIGGYQARAIKICKPRTALLQTKTLLSLASFVRVVPASQCHLNPQPKPYSGSENCLLVAGKP